MTDGQRLRGVKLAMILTDALDWGNVARARALLELLRQLLDEPPAQAPTPTDAAARAYMHEPGWPDDVRASVPTPAKET